MDFSVIFQLRTKKYWWMDVVFYFMISLLIATVLCYFIFLAKNSLQREDIQKETAALQTVGTDQQKTEEKYVITYQQKLIDFAGLLENHGLASNVFALIQEQTIPNVWFKQFVLDRKSNSVQLLGESDDMDGFSRQVAAFEKNKYVQNVVSLSSLLGEAARTEFSINLVMNQNIFSYNSGISLTVPVSAPPQTSTNQSSQTTSTGSTNTTGPSGQSTNTSASGQPGPQTKSSEKAIISFTLPLTPQVPGQINTSNYNITANVPYGTNVKDLTPSIIISPKATISPLSNISQDFTDPVIYRVTAEDGSIQDYAVTVAVGAQPQVAPKPSQSGSATPIIIVLIIGILAVLSVIIWFAWKKMKSQKIKI